MKYNSVIYYKDELNDEFSGVTRNEKIIPDDYKYINRNPFWNIGAFIVHRIFLTPFAYLYCKLKFGMKVVNKKVLKKQKGGYFLFGNHTQVPGDGFIQAMIAFPKKSYAVVNSDSVAIYGTENLMKMIGTLPLPSGLKGYRNFQNAMFERTMKSVVSIFPEAHIWPYYTKIRPFPETAFKYPIKAEKPTFSFTVTYQKRKYSKNPRMIVYIDGPFYANKTLKSKEQVKALRDDIYSIMCEHCEKHSDYEYIKYVKKESLIND